MHEGKQYTKESTKKDDFLARRRAPKARSRARFLAQGRAPKTTILCTRESTKKRDLEHDFLHEGKQYTKESTKKDDFWHEGEHQKHDLEHDFLAQGRAPKTTILCMRGEHQKARSRARVFARGKAIHEGEHQKGRFLARRRAPKARSRARFLAQGRAPKPRFCARGRAPKSGI